MPGRLRYIDQSAPYLSLFAFCLKKNQTATSVARAAITNVTISRLSAFIVRYVFLGLRKYLHQGLRPHSSHLGLRGDTGVTSVQDQPVVGDRDLFLRDMLHQLLFRFQRGFAVVCQADAVGYAEHMCVDSHCWLVVDDRGYDVAVLRPTPGNFCNSSISDGTTPSKSDISIFAMPTKCFDLLLG